MSVSPKPQPTKKSSFLRQNTVFFIGSLVVSGLNYLYYPVLGRLLPIESFGETQVLISFYTQITIFLSVLTLVAINVVVNEQDSKVANTTVSELERLATYAGIGVLLIITLLAIPLQYMFKFESFWPFIVIGLVFVVSIPLSFRTAYLRGKSDFFATSLQGIIGSASKIIVAAVLVFIGLKTAGAVGGILAAQLIALVYAMYKAHSLGFVKTETTSKKINWAVIKPLAPYAGLVLVVSLLTTLQYSLDVSIIKYLFSAEVAGQYAGISTIARIIFFLTGSFAVVLLSAVKTTQSPETNYKLLLRSLGITMGLGGVTTLIFCLLPTEVTHLLFGTRYDVFAHVLPQLSIAMLAMSLVMLIANYHIALRHNLVVVFVAIGAIITYCMIFAQHASVEEVVNGVFVGSISMLILLVGWTAFRALPILRKAKTV
jgi:O-antigen/teichoic acid export membrane protein